MDTKKVADLIADRVEIDLALAKAEADLRLLTRHTEALRCDRNKSNKSLISQDLPKVFLAEISGCSYVVTHTDEWDFSVNPILELATLVQSMELKSECLGDMLVIFGLKSRDPNGWAFEGFDYEFRVVVHQDEDVTDVYAPVNVDPEAFFRDVCDSLEIPFVRVR